MKKLFFAFILIGIAASVNAREADPRLIKHNLSEVTNLLNSPEVQREIGARSITSIEVNQANQSTSWYYTLHITTIEVPKKIGPASKPCHTWATQQIINGVAGPVAMKPMASTLCE